MHPENGLTVPEMLKAWTIGSQYAMEQESKLGTLEEGKQADIVIFDGNLLTMNIRESRNIKVAKTICDGLDVYSREES